MDGFEPMSGQFAVCSDVTGSLKGSRRSPTNERDSARGVPFSERYMRSVHAVSWSTARSGVSGAQE